MINEIRLRAEAIIQSGEKFANEGATLIKELEQVDDIALLQAIKVMLHYGLKNEGRISIDQYNLELDEAEAEIERGELITNRLDNA
jgi:hypothetical protein